MVEAGFNFKPISGSGRAGAVRLSDRMAAELEARILRGEIPAGVLLPSEFELCSAFGVSRTVVRDALRTLDAKGLVEAVPGRGTTVTEPNEDALTLAVLTRLMRSNLTLLEVIRARAAIDVNLGPLAAANATDEHIAAVGQGFEEFQGAVANRQWRRVHIAHTAFHVRLLDAVELPALRVILASVQEVIMLGALPFAATSYIRWEAEVPLHHAILAALQARDQSALRGALERHYDWIASYPETPSTLFRDIFALEDVMRTRSYPRSD